MLTRRFAGRLTAAVDRRITLREILEKVFGMIPRFKSKDTILFFLSAKKWIKLTSAKGLAASAGRYGGTYAHKDIAFEFGIRQMRVLTAAPATKRLKE